MEPVAIPGAEIYYEENFLSAEEATTLFNTLLAKCARERRKTSFKGSVHRDEAYYGDPGTNYTYSRREYKPLAWIPELLSLKARRRGHSDRGLCQVESLETPLQRRPLQSLSKRTRQRRATRRRRTGNGSGDCIGQSGFRTSVSP